MTKRKYRDARRDGSCGGRLGVVVASLISFGQDKAGGGKEGSVGSETCQGSHPEVMRPSRRALTGKTECEACHGPGVKHAEAQGKGRSSPSRKRRGCDPIPA